MEKIDFKRDKKSHGFKNFIWQDTFEEKLCASYCDLSLCRNKKMETLGIMAGGVAHDFNNILSSIIGYTEMVLEEEKSLSSEGRLKLSLILKAGKQGQEMVNNLLSFARCDKEENELLDLSVIIGKVLSFLRPTVPARIRVYQKVKISEGTIFACEGQIFQAILNLCVNGVQAMEGGKGNLEVHLDYFEPDGEEIELYHFDRQKYLWLTVTDTGRGIEPEITDKIFQPLFSSGKRNGTGMGLSVVYQVVKKYRGYIAIETEAGKGTSFHIFLPFYNKRLKSVSF